MKLRRLFWKIVLLQNTNKTTRRSKGRRKVYSEGCSGTFAAAFSPVSLFPMLGSRKTIPLCVYLLNKLYRTFPSIDDVNDYPPQNIMAISPIHNHLHSSAALNRAQSKNRQHSHFNNYSHSVHPSPPLVVCRICPQETEREQRFPFVHIDNCSNNNSKAHTIIPTSHPHNTQGNRFGLCKWRGIRGIYSILIVCRTTNAFLNGTCVNMRRNNII